jgi:hypothetical protein
MSSPSDFPIFKELEFRITRQPLVFKLKSEHRQGRTIFYITTSIQTPGYSAKEKWVMMSENGTLTLSKLRP